MTLAKWALVIVTLGIVAYILIQLNAWSQEWKYLFYFLDDWTMLIGITVGLIAVSFILRWIITAEIKYIK